MGKAQVKNPGRQEWDQFVSVSPQGTIFSTTAWLDLIGQPYKILGVYKGDELIGGAANFDEPAPLTPFQGIIGGNEVTKALLDYLPNEFYNSPSFKDVRPFKWAGGWDVDIRYTYILNKPSLEKLEKRPYRDIEKFNSMATYSRNNGGFEEFNQLYGQTFERKGLERTASPELLKRFFDTIPYFIFYDKEWSTAVVMMYDNRRAYYILGASDGSGKTAPILWEALGGFGNLEIDLVGCNDEKIALFKRGFSGVLTPYYGLRRK